jgi:hypothetical protein
MIFTVSYLMYTRNSFFMWHMLLAVMHESWIGNIERAICHIWLKNTNLHFYESLLLFTSLEFEIGRKNLFRTIHAYINSTEMILCCVFIFLENRKYHFQFFSMATQNASMIIVPYSCLHLTCPLSQIPIEGSHRHSIPR